MSLFEKPLTFYNRDSETFKLVVGLLTAIGRGLTEKHSG